jgi:hypothetical protein
MTNKELCKALEAGRLPGNRQAYPTHSRKKSFKAPRGPFADKTASGLESKIPAAHLVCAPQEFLKDMKFRSALRYTTIRIISRS